MIEQLITILMFASTVNMLILLLVSILIKFNYTPNWLMSLLCPKCLTLWITLLLTQNILIAGTASYVAYMIDKYTMD